MICTFDLVKVWIIPNSTVCISLLEQIFEFQKSLWWAAFINNIAIDSRISVVGNLLSIWSQLESPHIMCLKFQKVKYFFKNNFQKNPNLKKTAEISHFLQMIFFKIFSCFLSKFHKKTKKMIRFFAFYTIRFTESSFFPSRHHLKNDVQTDTF